MINKIIGFCVAFTIALLMMRLFNVRMPAIAIAGLSGFIGIAIATMRENGTPAIK